MTKTTNALALAGLAAVLLAIEPAHAGKTLDAIKSRGQLVCGEHTGLAGFSQADSQGHWSGLDVDVCRAIAAAILGDATKVKWVPLTAAQRPEKYAPVAASIFSNTTGLRSSLLVREKSVMFFSVVVPDCTHTVAPFNCLALLI